VRLQLIRITVILAAAILAPASRAAAEDCHPRTDFILTNLHIVDVDTGEVRRDRALRIINGLIQSVMASAELGPVADADLPVVDGGGQFAVPGLIDMHVHTLWADEIAAVFLSAFLDHGVTTVRDMGGELAVLDTVRNGIAECSLDAPHVIAPGPFLDGPQPVDPSLSIALEDGNDVRDAVARLSAAGVDFLKIYTLLPAELLPVLVEQASANGLTVAGHLPAGVPMTDPAVFQMDSIEHMAIETGGLCAGLSETDCLNGLQVLALNRVGLTPTILVRLRSTGMAREGFDTGPIDQLPPIAQGFWQSQQAAARERADDDWFAQREAGLADLRRLIRLYQRLGGPILAGTDTGNPFVYPGASLADEIAALIEAGLTPLEALRAATRNAADVLGDPSRGSLRPGSRADILLLNANPLEDITALGEPEAVYLRGRQVRG